MVKKGSKSLTYGAQHECTSSSVLGGKRSQLLSEVGALLVVAHPDIEVSLSPHLSGLALLLVRQPEAVYHPTHSLTSPFSQVQCFSSVYKLQALQVSVYDVT